MGGTSGAGGVGEQRSRRLRDHRGYVGLAQIYDLAGAVQFSLLTYLDLREHHFLLDVGCGSLRAGRLFIPYLLPGRYFGIEPQQWLVEEGIRSEVGQDLVDIKQPVFSYDSNFTLSSFNQGFDFILANSIFTHASQSQIRRCLAEAKKVMGPASIFAATFVEGEENYPGDSWVYPDVITYTLGHMVNMAEEQGLTCKPFDWPHPGNQRWLVIANPENDENIPLPSDAMKLAFLKNELRFRSRRLSKLEGHPYVRFGLRMRQLLQRIRRLGR